MRISDWSSDVCSSDLHRANRGWSRFLASLGRRLGSWGRPAWRCEHAAFPQAGAWSAAIVRDVGAGRPASSAKSLHCATASRTCDSASRAPTTPKRLATAIRSSRVMSSTLPFPERQSGAQGKDVYVRIEDDGQGCSKKNTIYKTQTTKH